MVGYRYAFSLSKEEVRNATPPGTVTLIGHDLERTRSGAHEEVHDHIRLAPQPSADPADPLNWPLWRKFAILTCVSVFAFIGNFQSASLASGLPFMVMAFGHTPMSFPTLTHLMSVNILFLGASNLWWVPLANTFGRRPIILLCTLGMTVFGVWAAVAKDFNSLLAARCFTGIFSAPSETLSPDIVGEVFFVHQRGRAMAFYTIWLALGSLIASLTGSYIAVQHGWRWILWTNVILCGFLFGICFLFAPETLFDRERALSRTNNGIPKSDEKHHSTAVEEVGSDHSFRPYTFMRSLGMGVYRPGLGRRLLAPWFTLLLPGVWMLIAQYSGLVAGVVTISVISSQLVAEPPYLWGQNTGLINVGAIIGSILGLLYTYVLADRILTRRAKRETHGYGEPESRLITQFPGLVAATFGVWIFGACAQNPGKFNPMHPHANKGWVGLEVGYGMLSFGLMQAPSVGFNYIIEAYNAVSGDCFVMIVFARSIVSFAWTFFVSNWVESAGPMQPFGIFGMLLAIFTLLTVPVYIWGKRMRIATERWLPKEVDH